MVMRECRSEKCNKRCFMGELRQVWLGEARRVTGGQIKFIDFLCVQPL